MNEYRAAVRRFYEAYRPIAKRYGLKMYSHTSIHDDGWIKIFKGEGENRQQVIKVEEADDADSKQAAAVAADYIDNPVMEFGA